MTDETKRAMRLCALMNDRIRNMSPQERDRLLQRFKAEAMRPSQKSRTLRGVLDFLNAQKCAHRKASDE